MPRWGQLDQIGTDSEERLCLCLLAGDVSARLRHADGTVEYLAPTDWTVLAEWLWPDAKSPLPPCWFHRQQIEINLDELAEQVVDALKPVRRIRSEETAKAGRRPNAPGTTVGERRLAMLEQGLSVEEIAEKDNVDIEVVRRSIERGEKRRRGQ